MATHIEFNYLRVLFDNDQRYDVLRDHTRWLALIGHRPVASSEASKNSLVENISWKETGFSNQRPQAVILITQENDVTFM